MGVPNITAPPSSGGGGGMGYSPNKKSVADGAKGTSVKRSGKKGNRKVGATKGASAKHGSGYRW